MKNLRSMLPNEIEAVLAGLGEPKYRAKSRCLSGSAGE